MKKARKKKAPKKLKVTLIKSEAVEIQQPFIIAASFPSNKSE
jgi:hypothetical protein